MCRPWSGDVRDRHQLFARHHAGQKRLRHDDRTGARRYGWSPTPPGRTPWPEAVARPSRLCDRERLDDEELAIRVAHSEQLLFRLEFLEYRQRAATQRIHFCRAQLAKRDAV